VTDNACENEPGNITSPLKPHRYVTVSNSDL